MTRETITGHTHTRSHTHSEGLSYSRMMKGHVGDWPWACAADVWEYPRAIRAVSTSWEKRISFLIRTNSACSSLPSYPSVWIPLSDCSTIQKTGIIRPVPQERGITHLSWETLLIDIHKWTDCLSSRSFHITVRWGCKILKTSERFNPRCTKYNFTENYSSFISATRLSRLV